MTDLVERYRADDFLRRGPGVPGGISVMTFRLDRSPVHWHDFYELTHVVEGTARHVVNGVVGDLGPGSTVLLSPADFHEFESRSGAPLCAYNVVIESAVMEPLLDEIFPAGTVWGPWVVPEVEGVEADVRRLWREASAPAFGSAAVMRALLRCVLVGMARRSEWPAWGTASSQQRAGDVRRAISFVERHFREPISLGDVARVAHLSPNYVSERFRESTGLSFQAYLQDRRLTFARSLLGATDLSVREVCRAAGFNSTSHFGRAFRRRYGDSPSALRRTQVGHGAGVLAGSP